MSTISRVFLAVSAALFVALGISAPALAAPIADRVTLTHAGIDASQLEPGWIIKGNEILWQHEDVRTSLTAAATCKSGYVCVWENKNYGGRILQWRKTGVTHNMTAPQWGFNDQMSSWWNRRTYDARWYYDAHREGTSRCMESGNRNPDVGAGITNVDNDEMTSIYIYASDSQC